MGRRRRQPSTPALWSLSTTRRLALAAGSAILVALALDPIAGTASSQPLGGAHKVQNLLARSRQVLLAPRLAGVATPGQVSPPDSNIYSTTAAAVDPTNHANLFAAANMLTAPPDAGFISTNSGTTWSMSTVPLPGTSPNTFAFYPGAAFDASGALYFSSMPYSVTGTAVNTQIVVSKSFDKGSTWAAPATVESSNIPEKPLLAVDTTASSYHNRVYVGYDTNPAHGSEPLVMAHSDDGQTWTKTQIVDTGGDFGAVPAVGPGGDVYVAWDDWCGFRSGGTCQNSAGRILLARSTNGGASFDALGSPVLIAGTTIGFGVVPPNYSNSCGGVGPNAVNPAPSLDVDRSGGVHNGSLYAAWADAQASGSRLHIYLSRSLDNGAHWSSPVQLDTGNQNDAWEPAVSVDQTNGAVTVAWYDRRDDPGNKFYGVYYTQSTDGGATFLTSQVPVSTGQQSDPTLDCSATGDYMQMTSVDGVAHPFWSDTRNGRNQIFTAALDEATLAQNLLPLPSWFANASHATVGNATWSVAVGDFNGDGKPDLAVADTHMNGGISILLGKGDGTFGPSAIAIAALTGYLAAGDFNKDGKLDLAVTGSVNNAGYITGGLFIALGKGDGTFQSPVVYPGAGGPGGGRITVADVNNDGNLDIVAANGGNVAVFLGKGDGTFQAATFNSTGNGTVAVAVADFNGDGKPDIAAANQDAGPVGTVSILIGKGDGTFGAALNYGAGARPDAIITGDFNGDGRPDIAVANGLSTSLSVLVNKGDGTFLPAVSYGSGSYTGIAIASADFNQDGKLDLVVTGQPSNASVWLGRGDGTFSPGGKYPVGTGIADIVATDLNGDHRPDLVMADQLSNDVPILIGVTRSALAQPTSITFPDQFAKTAGPVRTVTVSNSGTADLHLAMANVIGPNARDFSKVGDTCSGAAVLAGGSCTVSLRFAPTAVGSRVASLQVTDDATGSPQLTSLGGTALLRQPPTLPAGSSRNRDTLPPPPLPHRAHTSSAPYLAGEGQSIPSPNTGGGQPRPSPIAVEGQGGAALTAIAATIRLMWSDLESAFRILIR